MMSSANLELYQKNLDAVTEQALKRLKEIAADLQQVVTNTVSKIPDVSTYYDDTHTMGELLRGLNRSYEDYRHLRNLSIQLISKAEIAAQSDIKKFITQIQAADKLNRERLTKTGMTFPERKELDTEAFYYIHLTSYSIEWTDTDGSECSISFGGTRNFSDMIKLSNYKTTNREKQSEDKYNSWNPLEFSHNIWEEAFKKTILTR